MLTILVTLIGSSIYTVQAGEVGVITRFGAVTRVADPGLGFKIPLVENITQMDTRTQKEQVDAEAASQDLQQVHSTIALNYHLDGPKAVRVYQNIGINYTDKIIAPAMQEAFKSVTSQYTAQDLIDQREKVKEVAFDKLKAALTPYNIIVDNFNIVNFDFSADFDKAIEAKQVAQQNLAQAETEAKTAVAQAQGQADAQKALKDSGSLSPEYLQYLAVNKWNGVLPTATSGVPFLQLPVTK